jgi:hypothetical protein
MCKQPLVVLVGDSVLIDGVAVGLTGERIPEIVRIHALTADIAERLKSLKPDMVVFELDTPFASSLFSLLREQPGILLLGLDLDDSQALVLNSHQHATQTVSDLYHIVQIKAREQARFRREVDQLDKTGNGSVGVNADNYPTVKANDGICQSRKAQAGPGSGRHGRLPQIKEEV